MGTVSHYVQLYSQSDSPPFIIVFDHKKAGPLRCPALFKYFAKKYNCKMIHCQYISVEKEQVLVRH